jgi:TolA-binding protein
MCQTSRYEFLAAIALAASVGLTEVPPAFAQPPGRSSPADPVQRPTISPYLNLFNRGGNTGLNYHNFVRPQQQLRQATGQLQNQVRSLQTGVRNLNQAKTTTVGAATPVSTGRMAPTGHPASFGNLGGYFPESARR